jgi:hypothetical protein
MRFCAGRNGEEKRARTGLLRVERLLHVRQQIGRAAVRALGVGHEVRLVVGEPPVGERLVGGGPLRGVDGQAVPDKVAGGLGHVRPVFLCVGNVNGLSGRVVKDGRTGLELVVAGHDRFRLFLLGVAIEGRVATEQEVGDDTDCPDIDRLAMADYAGVSGKLRHSNGRIRTLLEDLRGHVLRS